MLAGGAPCGGPLKAVCSTQQTSRPGLMKSLQTGVRTRVANIIRTRHAAGGCLLNIQRRAPCFAVSPGGDGLTTRGWAPPDDADVMALALATPVPEAAALAPALAWAPAEAMTGAGSCPLLVPLNVNCTLVGRTPVWPFDPMTLKAVTLQSTTLLSGEHLERCAAPASQHGRCEAVQCCLLTGCPRVKSLCRCITAEKTWCACPGPVTHSAGEQGRQLLAWLWSQPAHLMCSKWRQGGSRAWPGVYQAPRAPNQAVLASQSWSARELAAA